MSYGLTIFSGGSGRERFRRAVTLARAAEEAGVDAIWTGELYNRSATVPMALFADATERVRIGSNIAYGVGRTPLVWAAEARDLDELSMGRLVLGLGNGTPRMMEDWHGVNGEAPVQRMEELVGVLRALWRLHEGPVDHDGRFYRVHVHPTSTTAPPVQVHLPIWVAGVNQLMIEVAGRVADGLVGHPMFTAKYMREVVRPALAAGALRVGRDPAEISVMGMVMCGVDEDVDVARDSLAFAISQYAASHVYDRLFELHGWSEAQLAIRDAAKRGDTAALIAAVPEEAIDLIGVACAPGELAEHVARHGADYDHLVVVAPAWGLDAGQLEVATWSILEEMRPLLAENKLVSPPWWSKKEK